MSMRKGFHRAFMILLVLALPAAASAGGTSRTEHFTVPASGVREGAFKNIAFADLTYRGTGNAGEFTVTLSGYSLSDGNSYGDGKAAFPSGSNIGPGEVIVVAQKASGVGFTPDYELKESNAAVPNMTPLNGGIIWGNNGDEAILRDSSGADVDVLVYGSGSYAGVTPHPGVGWSDNSLERKPPDRDTDDCSADFWERYTPNPGQVPLN